MKYNIELKKGKANLLETLAAIEHIRWSRWHEHVCTQSTMNSDGSMTIPKDKVDRWQRQMTTDYLDLSEEEKESDRKEARITIKQVLAFLDFATLD